MKFRWILFCLATGFVGTAHAEGGCPAGQYPIGGQGAMACAPMPQQRQQQQRQQAPRPTGEWVNTWGAIAMGTIDSNVHYGVPTGKMSKSDAESDARRRCASRGATGCRVMITYYDQCAVIVEPHIDGKPLSGGRVQFASAASIPKAIDIAQDGCQQENAAAPEAQCEVIYQACSEPFFQRY